VASQLNIAGGLLRVWIFLSICWIALFAAILGERSFGTVIAPPVVLGGLLASFVWVGKGFKPSPSRVDKILLAEATGKGLLLRIRLPDRSVTLVPVVQFTTDMTANDALAREFHNCVASLKGTSDSLSNYPLLRDYLYSWVIHRPRVFGLENPVRVPPEDLSLWVSPDSKAVWFRLPGDTLVEIAHEVMGTELLSNEQLLFDFGTWLRDGATNATLSSHPTLLAYLRQNTNEAKGTEIAQELASQLRKGNDLGISMRSLCGWLKPLKQFFGELAERR
jgi:hypothetical protein